MNECLKQAGAWLVETEFKPDLEKCLERVCAWFEGELLDRPPVRFSRHNAEYETADNSGRAWASLKDRWFDAEYQVEKFILEAQGKRFLAETFPVYWPGLGPHVFAACYGCPYVFGEVTAWAEPMLETLPAAAGDLPEFDWNCEYFKKLDEMTGVALEKARGRFLVGYTDIHPGMDWCAALRGTQALLTDFYDDPESLRVLCGASLEDFLKFFDYFDAKLKERRQLSVTWMNIPSFGKLHIPSCDFASMISCDQFEEYAMPCLERECLHMDHNIFHLDGKGVARHLDRILTLPKINAIQWVQGVGEDQPIMQWVPLIRKIQNAGKGVVVDVTPGELESFIAEVPPRGIYLCISTGSPEEEEAVLKRVEKW